MEGNNPWSTQLDMDNVPLMGAFDFENIRMRVGDMTADGELIGAVIEWWFIPLPWFRFRMKLETMHALAFIEKMNDVLTGGNNETETSPVS